jgi:predicted ATPase
MLGWSQIHEGKVSEGATQVRHALERYRATGANLHLPYLLTPLAEAARALERPDEGLKNLSEALTLVESTGERFYEAELHRVRGELLLEQTPDDHAPAEDAFQIALSVARSQEAKSFELRAAMSLARLRQSQGRPAEALDLLAPVYGRFTEGFDTPHLKEAKALLDELG